MPKIYSRREQLEGELKKLQEESNLIELKRRKELIELQIERERHPGRYFLRQKAEDLARKTLLGKILLPPRLPEAKAIGPSREKMIPRKQKQSPRKIVINIPASQIQEREAYA